MITDAVISSDEKYRYWLMRAESQDEGFQKRMLFVMLNPSTADANTDDPTIRRCIGFAKREGFKRMEVINLFGFRATDPKQLFKSSDPIGPENLYHVKRSILAAETIVAAWGASAVNALKSHEIIAALHNSKRPIFCFGTTKAGFPRHPLYVKKDQPLEIFWPASI